MILLQKIKYGPITLEKDAHPTYCTVTVGIVSDEFFSRLFVVYEKVIPRPGSPEDIWPITTD